MKITIHQPLYIFEIGQRANQEDSLYPAGEKATSEDRLFVLCDGMGGHEHGEVASQTVCKALGNWFSDNEVQAQLLTDNQLLAALEYAYNALDTKDNGGIKKMGTTLTLLYIHARGITAAHIGDSRIYHIRPQSSSPSGRLGGAILSRWCSTFSNQVRSHTKRWLPSHRRTSSLVPCSLVRKTVCAPISFTSRMFSPETISICAPMVCWSR